MRKVFLEPARHSYMKAFKYFETGVASRESPKIDRPPQVFVWSGDSWFYTWLQVVDNIAYKRVLGTKLTNEFI